MDKRENSFSLPLRPARPTRPAPRACRFTLPQPIPTPRPAQRAPPVGAALLSIHAHPHRPHPQRTASACAIPAPDHCPTGPVYRCGCLSLRACAISLTRWVPPVSFGTLPITIPHSPRCGRAHVRARLRREHNSLNTHPHALLSLPLPFLSLPSDAPCLTRNR